MGVSGAGKSTIGRLLAYELGIEFCDADDLHPPRNIERMTTGQPLSDAERWPWLHAVGRRMAESRSNRRGIVVACSALKLSYRDVLREHVPEIAFVFLDGPMRVVHERISGREHAFMPPSLLASQFLSLEPLGPNENGVRVNILQPPSQMVKDIIAEIEVVGALPPAGR